MKTLNRLQLICGILAIIILVTGMAAMAQPDGPEIIHAYPSPGEAITETRPNVTLQFSSPHGMDPSRYRIFVDGIEVTEFEETDITELGIYYRTPEVFTLRLGNHTLRTVAVDNAGNRFDETWNFTVTRPGVVAKQRIDVMLVIKVAAVGSAIIAISLSSWYYYLKKTREYSMEKFFAQNPRFKKYAVIFFPSMGAIIFLVLGFIYITGHPDPSPFSYEFLVLGTFLFAVTYYALHAQLERRRIARYEKAFAQFLFEMADAMRGGMDPTKAVLEMAKNEGGLLKKHIRIAADSLKMGRPFDEVMAVMAEGMNSPLVMRYSSLVGEASKIGGEIGLVLYRAAKDMDDMIKIRLERRRQLSMQSMTIYIAIGVLVAIVIMLVDIYPDLGSIDLSFMGGGGLEGSSGSKEMDAMAFIEVKRRFFHLMLVNSMGAGLIIGQFIDGKVKYGLLYSIILLVSITAIFVGFIF